MELIKGFPLLTKREYVISSNEEGAVSHSYFVKPAFKWLPDFSNFCDDLEDKERYVFKDVAEGYYLTELEVISDKKICPAFCAMLIEEFGLMLTSSSPMNKPDGLFGLDAFVYLKFEHIASSIDRIGVRTSYEFEDEDEHDDDDDIIE